MSYKEADRDALKPLIQAHHHAFLLFYYNPIWAGLGWARPYPISFYSSIVNLRLGLKQIYVARVSQLIHSVEARLVSWRARNDKRRWHKFMGYKNSK
jgi:hypothetical protein